MNGVQLAHHIVALVILALPLMLTLSDRQYLHVMMLYLIVSFGHVRYDLETKR